MRKSVIGLLLLAVWLSGIQTPGRASCVMPTVEIQGRGVLRPGEQVTASGPYWWDECYDTITNPGGCGGSDRQRLPARDIELSIRGPVTKATRRHLKDQGFIGTTRMSLVIGREDAGEDGTLSFTFEVPDLPPGKYYLETTPVGSPTIIKIGDPTSD